jgi:hypothetical protein
VSKRAIRFAEGGLDEGETGGGAGVLRHASIERGHPQGLLLDDGEQMDDQLAHDERGLFPAGNITRKPFGKPERRCHRTSFMWHSQRLCRPELREAVIQ